MATEVDWSKAEQQEIVIIGSGPAGATAALYAARAGYNPLVLHGEVPGGQLTTTTDLENFPGWKGTGPGLVETIEKQAAEVGADFQYEVVTKVDFSTNPKKIETDIGTCYLAKSVIIATGAKAMYLGLPNEARLTGRGVSACSTCDGPLFKGKDVVVVGGGDVAAEEALALVKICRSVHMIHRRDELRACLPMKKRVAESQIKMVWDSGVIDVLGESSVTGVKVKNFKTGIESEIPCHGLFVCIGHKPSTELFKSYLDTDQQGYFVTNGSPVTKVPGVFVCGDCADKVYRQAVTSAGSGCMAALLAEKYLKE